MREGDEDQYEAHSFDRRFSDEVVKFALKTELTTGGIVYILSFELLFFC